MWPSRSQENKPVNRFLSGYVYAFGAAASYGCAQVLTRYGVSQLAPPLVGVTLSLFWGTLGLALLSLGDLRTFPRGDSARRGLVLFSLAGVTGSAGVASMYIALSQAPVVVVAPVLGVNPLVTLLCAAVFLRGLERVTLRLILGSVLVVVGVVCIAVATALHL